MNTYLIITNTGHIVISANNRHQARIAAKNTLSTNEHINILNADGEHAKEYLRIN